MRRSARLERAGALTPRDRIWAAIRGFGRDHDFSLAELMLLSGQRDDTVLTYLRGLQKGGFVRAGAPESVPLALRDRRVLRRFALVRDVGVDAPRVNEDGKPVVEGLGQQQMWNAARKMRGHFTWREIKRACAHPVSDVAAASYLRLLRLGGYLRVEREGGGHSHTVYSFIAARNTGPRAPIFTGNHQQVMDGNSGEIVYSKESGK